MNWKKSARHWRCLAAMRADALAEAHTYIDALEADREADRLAAYRRALAHIEARGTARMPDDEPPQASTLPHIDPAAPGLRTRWFRTRREALQYAENAGFQQRPERRRVWVDLAWREEWSLRAPSTCLSERTT